MDFNINLNPRPNHKNANAENKKRYIPLYNIKNLKSNSELKGTYFPDIIYMNNNNNIKCIKNCNEKAKNKKSGIEQYKDYKKSTNIEQKINPDLHSDIIHNTENLISKINMNLDLKRWYEFDSRTTFNLYHQTAYSPITDYNKKIKNEKEAFSETLKNKALGLKTVSNKAKAVILKNLYNNTKYKNNNNNNGTYFPDIIYMNDIKNLQKNNNERERCKTMIQQYKEYKKSTNIEQKINPDLRSDIVHNTENLISQINMKFDFKRWNEFDSRTTMNIIHQPAFSPLAYFNKNNRSEKEAFSDTLRRKAIGLKTISNKAKAVIQKNLYENDLEKDRNELEQKNNIKKLRILVENSKNNFLNLEYNNTERPSYNKKDKDFILENKTITNRLNKTKLYHDFLLL